MVNQKKFAVIISIVFIAISLVAAIILSVLYIVSANVDNMHSMVIDAGSTSSKLNLYKWKDYPFRTNGEIAQIKSSKVEPGISSYLNAPSNVYKSLEAPIAQLVSDIDSSEHRNVPVYLAATAGIRLTLIQDPLGSLQLFEVLRRGLLKSGLQVETPNERIRLLSGTEEGLFGWVSVNYVLRLINSEKQVDGSKTEGSLDLGGASTQIAFSVDSEPPADADVDYSPLKLFGKGYTVYSHSFLCYGKNEFEKRTLGTIIGDKTTSTIDNPCMLQGYTSGEIDASTIFEGPCMSGSYAKKTFGKELIKPAALNTFTFRGTGNVDECSRVIETQFPVSTCTIYPCSFNGVHQPNIRGNFRAYSAFAYAMGYLFPDQSQGLTLSQVTAKVNEFCLKQWTEVSANVSSGAAKHLAKYCFDGQYIISLLKHYGFKTDDAWKTITFGSKIKDTQVSWALGYMLDQTGNLPSESPRINLNLDVFIGLMVLCIVLFVAALIVLLCFLHGKCKNSE